MFVLWRHTLCGGVPQIHCYNKQISGRSWDGSRGGFLTLVNALAAQARGVGARVC